jgi:HPt (histidine-containing phosphotransfer) domain-containing protein
LLSVLSGSLERLICAIHVSENGMTSAQHLNPELLDELRMVMGTEFATLLQAFIVDSDQRMAAIDDALRTANADMLRRAAHSLKGSTGNMGAQYMAELCRQLEALTHIDPPQHGAALLEQLRAEFVQVQREINALPL